MTWINVELNLLDLIQNLIGSSFGDRFWSVITHLGDHGFIWIILTFVLLLYPKTRKIGIACLCALLIDVVLTNGLLKPLIARPRPFTYREYSLLIDTPKDYSFPSGHTAAAFSVAFVLFKEKWKVKQYKFYRGAMVLAGMIAFSRLYLYVHFPTDILGGIGIAYFCSLAGIKLAYLIQKRSSEQ